MIELAIPQRASPNGLTVLLIGAHSDDIEIGCGGTVLKLLRERDDVTVHWVVLSTEGAREEEARRSAARFLEGARSAKVVTHTFRDRFFPQSWSEVKEVLDSLKDIEPDLVFTHFRHDLHQDHRTVSELTWNAFRSHLVLEYEVPKFDGDLGSPNVFVPIEPELRDEKIAILMEEFSSQRPKRWFTEETFKGLMRIRGIESPVPTESAEGFYGRKLGLALASVPTVRHA